MDFPSLYSMLLHSLIDWGLHVFLLLFYPQQYIFVGRLILPKACFLHSNEVPSGGKISQGQSNLQSGGYVLLIINIIFSWEIFVLSSLFVFFWSSSWFERVDFIRFRLNISAIRVAFRHAGDLWVLCSISFDGWINWKMENMGLN